MNDNNYEDKFSLDFYKKVLSLAIKEDYIFTFFDEIDKELDKKILLWRHDVDFSPQRALFFANLEKDLNIKSTYFFQFNSEFYNIFEAPIKSIIKQIETLGHQVGLHFDVENYLLGSEKELNENLSFEKDIFQEILGKEIKAFSFHNTNKVTEKFTKDSYVGLINTYSRKIKSDFNYCSDSNGIWQFDELDKFISMGQKKIHVLTHPGWWLETKMSPRKRILKALEGRKKSILRNYDLLLEKNNRLNIK